MEPDQLSVADLFRRLKVGQLWGFLVAVVGLLAGSFVLGYKTADTVTEGKLNAINSQVAVVEGELRVEKAELAKLRSTAERLNEKDRFLSLYLRYELAREKVRQDPTRANQDESSKAREAFDRFVEELLQKKRATILKGAGERSLICFEDETRWPVPQGSRWTAEN